MRPKTLEELRNEIENADIVRRLGSKAKSDFGTGKITLDQLHTIAKANNIPLERDQTPPRPGRNKIKIGSEPTTKSDYNQILHAHGIETAPNVTQAKQRFDEHFRVSSSPPRMRPKTTEELRYDLESHMEPRLWMKQKNAIANESIEGLRDRASKLNIPLEHDQTPPRRAKTAEELRSELLSNHRDKLNPRTRGAIIDGSASEDVLRNEASTFGIPLEHDRTSSPNRKMNAAEQAAYNDSIHNSPSSSPSSSRSQTPSRMRTPLTKKDEEAAPSQKQKDLSKVLDELEERVNIRVPSRAGNVSPATTHNFPTPAPAPTSNNTLSPTRGSSRSSTPHGTMRAPSALKKPVSAPASTSNIPLEGMTESEKRIHEGLSHYASSDDSRTAMPNKRPSFAPVNSEGEAVPNRDYHRFKPELDPEMRGKNLIHRALLDRYIPSDEFENPYHYNSPSTTTSKIDDLEKELSSAKEPLVSREIGSTEAEHKEIMKQAWKMYNRSHDVFNDNPVAALSPLQKENRRLLQENSPYSAKAQESRDKTREVIKPFLTARTSSEIAQPYVKMMTRNPSKMYKELMGDAEREHLNDIRNEGAEHFNKNILPGIHAKYQVPGLLQHGHMGRDIGNATERFSKGLNSAVAQHKASFREMAIGAAQKHAGLQGQAAHILSTAADKDTEQNLKAVNDLENIRREDTREKAAHNTQLGLLGAADQARDQSRIDEQRNRFNEARDAKGNMLRQLSDIQNKYQGVQPIIVPPRIPSSAGSIQKDLASMAASAGGNLLNQAMNPQQQQPIQRKKGGVVKKAYGGIVNPVETAIQNAVVQKSDPIYELRRLLNMPDPVQHYAIGGQVSPIQAGAQEAQQYAGHSAMQKKLQRMRQPVPEIGLMGALADATGDVSGDSWLGHSLRAFNSGYSRQDKRREAQRQRIDSADDLEYKLQNDIEAKAQQEKTMALKERVANAQIGHYGAQNAHLGLQGEKLRHEMSVPKRIKLDSTDQAILKENTDQIRAAPKFLAKLDLLEGLSKKIDTGGFTSTMPVLGSPRFQSMITKGTQGDYDLFDKITNNLVIDATAEFGSRGGQRIAAIIEKGKPSRDMSPEGLQAIISEMKDAIKEEVELSHHVNDEYEMGVSPKSSLGTYAKSREDKRLKALEENRSRENVVPPQSSSNNKLALLNEALLASG
jgi:hypothetical protein